jgi:hypothetical protein
VRSIRAGARGRQRGGLLAGGGWPGGHPDDQADGTTAAQADHIDTALAESSAGQREWGICTECGMGRVAADDVPKLLDLHREILTATTGAR